MPIAKNTTRVLSCALLAWLGPVAARAQEGETGLYGIHYGSPDTFAEFHGFVNLEFRKFEGGVSSFDIHNFYFNAIAKVRANITVFGEIEWEHGLYGDPGNLKLDRAFIDWKIVRALAFRLGKFYTPFGLEIRNYQAPVRKLVSRPLLASELLYNEWTEVGANAYGELGPKALRFAYDVAVTNGPRGLTEDGLQGRDNNSNKAVIGRLSARPRLGENDRLEIGVSWSTNKYDDAGTRSATHLGADARLRLRGLDLSGEFVSRRGDDQRGDAGGRIRADADGYYVQAAYRLVKGRRGVHSLEPIARYERTDLPAADPGREDGVRTRWTVGLNYAPYDHFRLKGEYQSVKGSRSGRSDGVMLAVVADF